ncbi:MAG TPA: FAD-dependent monooxygenase [Candidatus Limnocylindrales bacterium]
MMVKGTVDVAIVGAGPAGSALAAALARRGLGVLVLEQAPVWRWRAGGVFTSPAAVAALERAGVDAATLREVTRTIAAMRLETRDGTHVRLTYGAEDGGRPAVGFDRSRLDPALEELARAAGATFRRGADVRVVHLPGHGPATLELADGSVTATVAVGADGAHSIVARARRLDRPVRLPRRVGLTWHVADPRRTARDGTPVDARMVVIDDGYVGLAPVPGERLNIGIVLGPTWHDAVARDGAAATVRRALHMVPRVDDDQVDWADAEPCDRIAGAWPLGTRVTQRAGPGWFLVGDAAGFLDPFTGEGLHRALVSTELAAPAIHAAVTGRASAEAAAAAYDRAMRRRFTTKDAVSMLVQWFLGHPRAFGYAARRLAVRPDVRATMGLVMGDLVPASRGLDPRFLAALLAP